MAHNTRWILASLGALVCLAVSCTQGDRKTSPDSALTEPAEDVETVEEHWPNGQLKLRKQVLRNPDGTLVDHGTYTCWYDNGRKEYEGCFLRGKCHGVATRWHRNGQKWIEEHFLHGKPHGSRCVWDENGAKRKEEHHAHGEPCGTWTVWDKHGKVKIRTQRGESQREPKP